MTVSAESTQKRPDIVLKMSTASLGVLELKRSVVSVAEGIRQNYDSQKKEFIRPFFATVQLVMAGNETEGLRYGVIETPQKYFLRWVKTLPCPRRATIPLRELGQNVQQGPAAGDRARLRGL